MEKYILIYLAFINILAMSLACYDKAAAKKIPERRVPEKTLFIVAFLGGAAGEYLVMRLIRHKTLHKKFMIGLPVIIFLHISAFVAFILYQNGML